MEQLLDSIGGSWARPGVKEVPNLRLGGWGQADRNRRSHAQGRRARASCLRL